jgi:putative redox protein
MPRRSTKIVFTNPDGHALAGRLELPAEEPRAYAVFAHCFTCTKDVLAASRVSRALGERGYGVLRFDFTGLGASEGDFANEDFASNVEDLEAAAAYLADEYEAPRLLVGHSLGGAAVLAAAEHIGSVRAVATLAAPSDASNLGRRISSAPPAEGREDRAVLELPGGRFEVKRSFLEDLDRRPLGERLRQAGAALLVFHSPDDRVVAIEHARKIFDAAPHPKSFVAVDGADHMLSEREDSVFVAEVLAAWAARYVEDG